MPIVTLLTDFGTADHYVGVIKGVVLGAAPDAQVVDLGHEIAPGDIEGAAFSLLAAYPFFPAGSVHVAVIDPGVGTRRRVLVAEAAGQFFVGPDNGLFSYLLDREPGATVREATNDRFYRKPVSATFHGRDVFAPLGAALAAGTSPAEVGEIAQRPIRLPPLEPRVEIGGRVVGRILHVDRFGNCITNVTVADVAGATPTLRAAGGVEVTDLRPHYAGSAGDRPFLIWGSSGFLEVSINGGSAAQQLGLVRGAEIEVRAADRQAG